MPLSHFIALLSQGGSEMSSLCFKINVKMTEAGFGGRPEVDQSLINISQL